MHSSSRVHNRGFEVGNPFRRGRRFCGTHLHQYISKPGFWPPKSHTTCFWPALGTPATCNQYPSLLLDTIPGLNCTTRNCSPTLLSSAWRRVDGFLVLSQGTLAKKPEKAASGKPGRDTTQKEKGSRR